MPVRLRRTLMKLYQSAVVLMRQHPTRQPVQQLLPGVPYQLAILARQPPPTQMMLIQSPLSRPDPRWMMLSRSPLNLQ